MTEILKTPIHLRRVNAALGLREVPDYQAALDQLLKAQQEAPRDVDVLLALGLTYQDLHLPDEAETSLRSALGLAPDEVSVRTALAGYLTSQGREEEAILLLKPLIERGTSNSEIWYQYAIAVIGSNPAKAFSRLLQEAERAFAPDPPSRPVIERLWQAYAAHSDPRRFPHEALQFAEEGLKELPDDSTLRKLRAQALVHVGRYEEGLKVIRQLQAEGSVGRLMEEYLALLGTGRAYETDAFISNTSDGEGIDFYSAAKILFYHGSLEAAVDAARDALQYEDKAYLFVPFALDMAMILAHGGEWEEARNTIKRVRDGEFTEDEDEPPQWYLEDLGLDIQVEAINAHISLVNGQYQTAIEHYKRAEANPNSDQSVDIHLPVVCCYRGHLTAPLPESDNYEQTARRAIQANLATAYCLAGSTKHALVAANAAIEIETDAPEMAFMGDPLRYVAHAVLGCVHLARSETEQARQAWRDALDIIDYSPNLQKATGLLQQWLTDLEE